MIRHTGIRVKDMDKMVSFYRRLGLRMVSRRVENWEGVELEVSKLMDDGDMVLELIKTKSFWPNSHVCFSTDRPVNTRVYYEKGNVVYTKDPEGNFIELYKEG